MRRAFGWLSVSLVILASGCEGNSTTSVDVSTGDDGDSTVEDAAAGEDVESRDGAGTVEDTRTDGDGQIDQDHDAHTTDDVGTHEDAKSDADSVDDVETPDCRDRQPSNVPVSDVCWKGNEQVDCSSYEAVFGEFPGSQNSIEFFQDNNTYTSMQIDTAGLTAQSGTWTFETPQFDAGGQGPKLMTLSRCPGDFDQAAIAAEMGDHCYVRAAALTLLRWKRPGVRGARCELEPDQTYYLNILYTTDPEGTAPADLTWDCNGSDSRSCGNLMVPAFTP